MVNLFDPIWHALIPIAYAQSASSTGEYIQAIKDAGIENINASWPLIYELFGFFWALVFGLIVYFAVMNFIRLIFKGRK